MNENKKLYIILGVLLAITALFIGIGISNSIKQKAVYKEFMNAFEGNDNKLVYIGRPTCGFCKLLTPGLDDMASRYNFDYVYVNTDEINSGVMSKILKELNLTSVGTPYLAVVSNGKVVNVQNGYSDYDKLFNFLKTNEVIDKDAKLLLNYIGLSEYKTKIAENKLNVIVVGQSQCTYCVQAKVVLNQVVADNDIEINYISYDYLTDTEKAEFTSSLEYLSGQWGTPTTLIVKNKEVVATLGGLTTAEKYIAFFKENGVL